MRQCIINLSPKALLVPHLTECCSKQRLGPSNPRWKRWAVRIASIIHVNTMNASKRSYLAKLKIDKTGKNWIRKKKKKKKTKEKKFITPIVGIIKTICPVFIVLFNISLVGLPGNGLHKSYKNELYKIPFIVNSTRSINKWI